MSLFKTKKPEELDVTGEYELIIEGGEVLSSKSTGSLYASLTAQIRKDVNQEGAGLHINYFNFFFTEKSIWRAQSFLRDIGIPEGIEIQDEQHFVDLCIGKPFRAKLNYDDLGYLKIGKTFDTMYSDIKLSNPTVAKANKKPELEPVDDDDMPF